jgi:hypothetical protein
MSSSSEKISLYNLAGTQPLPTWFSPSPALNGPFDLLTRFNLPADLKNTSDDAIPNYLNSLKFKQSHYLQDVRLALGYGAFIVAALCFLWDYQLGWDSTKHYTAGAVVLYTAINGILTLWMTTKEKNIVYQGTAPSGEKVCNQKSPSSRSRPWGTTGLMLNNM